MIGAIIIKRKVPLAMEALNNRDIESALKDWADDAVLTYPGDIPGISGEHSGKEAIRVFYERDFEQFPTLRITPKHVAVSDLFDMTGNNTVIVQWDVEATNRDGFQILNSGVTVMKIRGGKAVNLHQYIFDTGKNFRKAWGIEG